MIRYDFRNPNHSGQRPSTPPPARKAARQVDAADRRRDYVPLSDMARAQLLDERHAPIHYRLFIILADAAAHDRPCPGNQQICDELDLKSTATASKLVGELEAQGSIRVLRYTNTRVVEIVETGASTVNTAVKKSKHWRHR